MAEYYLEIPTTTGIDSVGSGSWLIHQRLTDANRFRNPLAGPSVLGISSGASMGVAFVVLLSGSLGGVALSKLGFMGEIALSIAAVIGSLSVMALIVYVSQKGKRKCHVVDYRCDDRLRGKRRDRCT